MTAQLIQYATARQLLSIVEQAARDGRKITYKEAASALGRPDHHARMVAQVCDLLDGAAAWAGTPLLALVTVISSSGDYNEKAFATDPTQARYRRAILQKSEAYRFGEDDFLAIREALEGDLRNLSNKSAWDKVFGKFGHEGIYIRLAQGFSARSDGLHDIGSDLRYSHL